MENKKFINTLGILSLILGYGCIFPLSIAFFGIYYKGVSITCLLIAVGMFVGFISAKALHIICQACDLYIDKNQKTDNNNSKTEES